MDPIDKPPFDPHKLLATVKEFVDTKGVESKGNGGGSWAAKLIMTVAVIFGVCMWYWISWRRGRELARLRHEKNKAAIEKDQALAVKADENIRSRINRIQRDIDSIDAKISIIDADLQAEQKRYEADMRAVNSIRSWTDAGIR